MFEQKFNKQIDSLRRKLKKDTTSWTEEDIENLMEIWNSAGKIKAKNGYFPYRVRELFKVLNIMRDLSQEFQEFKNEVKIFIDNNNIPIRGR